MNEWIIVAAIGGVTIVGLAGWSTVSRVLKGRNRRDD